MTKLCSPMAAKGIKDPNCQQAIDLCTNCPLPACELDPHLGTQDTRRRIEAGRARRLVQEGLSYEEIAAHMGKNLRTIFRYLKNS